jgi:Na+-transporting methylmalonyl-CoA/oxaloacetate decarboxylase gamma subunit
MILRQVISTLWALVVGLAGGWLVLSPWALGVQKSGSDWADATKSEVGTGLFLILVALIVLIVVVGDVLARFREVGLIKPRPEPQPEQAPAPQAAPEVDMDSLLAVLAKVLADEVSRRGEPERGTAAPPQQRPFPQERPVPPESWRGQS